MFRSVHQQILGNGFYTDWDYAKVSDNDYFRDISQLEPGIDDLSASARTGGLRLQERYAQSTSTRHQDPDAPLAPPYDKVPEFCVAPAMTGAALTWTGLPPRCVSAGHCSALLRRTATVCSLSDGFVSNCPARLVHCSQGRREFHAIPDVGIVPIGPTCLVRRIMRAMPTVPIFSLDAGLVFDRETTLFGKSSIQTLEPRCVRFPGRGQCCPDGHAFDRRGCPVQPL